MALFLDIVHLVTTYYEGTILTFLIVFVLSYATCRKQCGIPPGSPFTLPFVGDLPLLMNGDILKTFRKLRNKHGNVFSFYMGRKLTIIINSYELLQKAAIKKGGLFSGRPQNFFTSDSCDKGRGILMSDGPFWQRQRKFTHDQLYGLGFGRKSFEAKIVIEVNSFIREIREQNGKPYDMRETIHASMANIIFSIVCGRRHDYKDPVFLQILSEIDHNTKVGLRVGMINNCFPFLRYLPWDPLGLNVTIQNECFKAFILKTYDVHKDEFRLDKDKPIADLMDAYIKQMEETDNDCEMNDFTFDQLLAVMSDLLGAGAETSATVVRWAVLYILRYPDIGERLRSDVDNVVPDMNRPCWDDRAKLPFVEAFIMELLRITNVAPLGLPRAILGEGDIKFEGYRIPKESAIFFNYETALLSPDTFEEPETFRPERFLDKSGRLLKQKEMIAFGIGRRVCLGEPVARMELFLFLTTLIKEFDFLPEQETTIPSLKPVLGMTNAPTDYKFRALPRC